MGQHTKGTWRVVTEPIEGNPYWIGNGTEVSSERGRIADCNRDGHRKQDEAQANAKLIAAAPDLLAELQEVLDWALTEKAPLRAQEIKSIRAAIAKATT